MMPRSHTARCTRHPLERRAVAAGLGASILLLVAVAAGMCQERAVTPQADGPSPPNREAGPRDILRLFELDESTFRLFRDHTALSADEFEPVYRLLYLMPRLDSLLRHRWRVTREHWNDLASEPETHRANLFFVAGRVSEQTRHELPAEAARRFGYTHFYTLNIESAADGRPLTICAREIPRRWTTGGVGQPISCDAIFLKVGEPTASGESLVFATDRIAWHPNEPGTSPHVSPGEALLGSYGMDVSRLDDVVHEQPLVAADREAFYQMLWTVRRIDPASIESRLGVQPLSVVPLLQSPQSHVGQPFRMRGTARRAIRVLVNDPDIRERFGIDHYYEIEIFVPLEQILRLVDAQDGEARSYRDFPVTVCAAALPRGIPQGEEIRERVEFDGFFFKLWSYTSRFVAGEGETADVRRRQLCPLLIAPSVERFEEVRVHSPWPHRALAVFAGGMLIAGLAARFWFARDDRPFRHWRKRRAQDVVVELPSSEPHASEAPDEADR